MKQQVIAFHYTLKDQSGKTIESSYKADPVMSLEGSGQIIPGLEKELSNLKVGDKKQINVKSAEAYGDHDKSLIVEVPHEQLPAGKDKIKVGDQFSSQSPDGFVQVFTVVGNGRQERANLTVNHPLAGQDLTFDVEIIDKRDATEEELTHGHAHGPRRPITITD